MILCGRIFAFVFEVKIFFIYEGLILLIVLNVSLNGVKVRVVFGKEYRTKALVPS